MRGGGFICRLQAASHWFYTKSKIAKVSHNEWCLLREGNTYTQGLVKYKYLNILLIKVSGCYRITPRLRVQIFSSRFLARREKRGGFAVVFCPPTIIAEFDTVWESKAHYKIKIIRGSVKDGQI